MVFHWNPSDSKLHKVARTFLGTLADLDNAVVCFFSIRSPISSSSSLLNKPLSIIPVTTGITVTGLQLGDIACVYIWTIKMIEAQTNQNLSQKSST